MRVSAGTTIAEQDCQVLDLSGGQERISILEEMRSEVEHCAICCAHGDITNAVKIHEEAVAGGEVGNPGAE